MLRSRNPRGRALQVLRRCLLLAGLCLLTRPEKLGAQDGARDERIQVVFSGLVLGSDGAPAEGAVVFSSAGGETVTAGDGSFALAVDVSWLAPSVQVTAVQGSGSTRALASVAVPLGSAGGTYSTGVLLLQQGNTCQPDWLPTFGAGEGLGWWARALAVFDDGHGDGPALYVGGGFVDAGGSVPALRIARWDGSRWSSVGSGLDLNGSVVALAVFDDGGGPALYAGGSFTKASGIPASLIAKWDGTRWASVGSGLSGPSFPRVRALAVFDDGDGGGPALYAGGSFTMAGSVACSRIAKWDGSTWSPLGSGTSSDVQALTVFDDGRGSGPALYAGGSFATAGDVTANAIAKWDGANWSALGSGLGGSAFSEWAQVLAVFDDGSGGGPALYVGGAFTLAGGVPMNRIARWDGSSWSPLGSGMNAIVSALTVYDDGTGGGPVLHAGGAFTLAGDVAVNRIAKWDGSTWSPAGNGVNKWIRALVTFDDGNGGGTALYAGGEFTGSADLPLSYIARWNGAAWSGLSGGVDASVSALSVFDDGSGSGPELYAGGAFTLAGGAVANRIAKWNGATWSPLGSGMDDPVQALAVFDDGGGPALYAGGHFTTAGGMPTNHIAKWDGSGWMPLGSGMDGSVLALTVYAPSGDAPVLCAGGTFLVAGGIPASRIARWDGASWAPLGSGVDNLVSALTTYEESGRLVLCAGGLFTTAGGVPADHIAKWNGSTWSRLGVGLDNWVQALTVFDDGNGPALYAGGLFSGYVAKWDGANWSSLAGGRFFLFVSALAVHDDGGGGGPALYAGGWLALERWNGSSWSKVGSDGPAGVRALTNFAGSGGGPALYAAGSFTNNALDSTDRFLARWGCAPPPPVWIGLGGGTSGVAGVPHLSLSGTLTPTSDVTLDLVNGPPSALAVLFLASNSQPTPFVGGTLHAFPFDELLVLGTDPAGQVHLSALFPGATSGTQSWFQTAIQDGSVPTYGASLSNGVLGTVP